jgi:hypothetical protein
LSSAPVSIAALTVVVDPAGAAVVVVAAGAAVVVVVVSSVPPQAASAPPRPAPRPTAAPAIPADGFLCKGIFFFVRTIGHF